MKLHNKFNNYFKNIKFYYIGFLKWLILGILVGIVGGLLGAAFAHVISFATSIRFENNWLVFLLPVGGIISVAVYKLCKVTDIGTNDVFESVRTAKHVPILLAPAVFCGTVITHFLGGSAGREGAALQLGGSISTLFGKLFRLNEKSRHILTMASMGALFSALFGTPLAAFVFAIEVVSVGNLCSAAFLPGIAASLTAYKTSTLLGTHPERFNIKNIPEFDINILWKVMLIAVLSAMVGAVFCKAMHLSCHLFKKYFSNEYIRILVGSAIIIILTVLLNTNDYNGGGIEVVNRIFQSEQINTEAFLLKIIFTAITIGAGFKGGEIVPTIFIGATFGATVSSLVGFSPAFGAAVGIVALFCAVTNCPIATILLSAEMFSSKGLSYLALAAIVSFVLSGYTGLYTGQKLIFSKISEDVINQKTH